MVMYPLSVQQEGASTLKHPTTNLILGRIDRTNERTTKMRNVILTYRSTRSVRSELCASLAGSFIAVRNGIRDIVRRRWCEPFGRSIEVQNQGKLLGKY